MRILHTDFDSLALDKHLNDVVVEKYIRLRTCAPDKHQQNLAERYIGSIKDGIRTVMVYNKAPICYWRYAMDYFCYTFNNLPRINETRSRNESFFGVKSDLSHLVPFYSSEYYHSCPEERVTLPEYGSGGKAFTCKYRSCRMLCYADAYVDHTIKNSYIILTGTGSIVVRHDYYFRHFTPFPSLLNAEVENRRPSTFVGQIPGNYDDMFIDLRTDNDATNGNHLQSTSNDADYDQLLGQVEYGSIPLQSSILRNL
jgi:hypothetical protein